MRLFGLFSAARMLLASALAAQSAAQHVIRGAVATQTGTPVRGANVFLLEAVDAAITDSTGRFALRTSATGRITIVVRQIGFAPATIIVPVDTLAEIQVALLRAATTLTPIRVQAGAYTAGNERGMTLTALEVVSTPGATANLTRAIQTLPGVQNVDEGDALFVRGGDATETKMLLNNTVMLSPYNYETPAGHFTVTVDPFLLDGIFFNSGGFGARYGNALSGIVDLRTAGRPAQNVVTGVAGLASVSTGADLALSNSLGVHATAARNDTRLLFRLNGATRSYSPAPNGTDVSGSVIYSYRPTAEIKTFAIDRHNDVGIAVEDPSYNGGYSADIHSSMIQSGWKDVFGSVSPTVSVSYSTAQRDELFGVFDLNNMERWSQAFAQIAWETSPRLTLRTGGDADWRDASFVGSIPASATDRAPGAPLVKFDSRSAGDHNGIFSEADIRPLEHLRLILGARSDYSSFSRARTRDPRISAAYKIGAATVTAAAGEYHQVADPLYYASGLGTPGLLPMSARQLVLGGQLGDEKPIARVELYRKQYHDLVGLTRDKVVTSGGAGETSGIDVFARKQVWPFFSTRVTYSFLHARRTDPSSGVLTRSPFDITHSVTLIGDQTLPLGWSLSAAWRYATGKPFTPVTGATFDPGETVWQPTYGTANSERMPSYEKFDLSFSRVVRRSVQTTVVYFLSLDNVLDRDNLYEYTYNPDYTRRIPVRSLFKRSFYFGASLSHTRD